ncbi:MAG TPA: NAD-dependent deacylase [Bacteroidetes bacterium]|nr:NAD-dependent deacylase [Bacteroidota bacterium]
MKKNIVVLTGAGISAESGIPTFRGADGLWEGHKITDVASPGGWEKDREMVLEFYNVRRRGMLEALPNPGHAALVALEEKYNVLIITQNIDNLHERAGSKRILHLHGEIMLARSTENEALIYALEPGQDIVLGDTCELGSQLRPHIVWFGEDVPEFPRAVQLTQMADILIIVGTSMVVYPANTLLEYAPEHAEIYLVDPNQPEVQSQRKIEFITEPGGVGLPPLVERLLAKV